MTPESSTWTPSRVRKASQVCPAPTVRRASKDLLGNVDLWVNLDLLVNRANRGRPVPLAAQVRRVDLAKKASRDVQPL